MIYAEMDTGNFTFRAFGRNVAEAHRLIEQAWAKHCKEYRFVPEHESAEELNEYYGINVAFAEVGGVLRDWERIE